MNSNLIACIAITILLACGNNNSTPNETESTTPAEAAKQTSSASTSPGHIDAQVTGDWILYYIANDDNGNKILDEVEIAGAVHHWGKPHNKTKAIWQFDANGSYSSREENIETGQTENSGEGGKWDVKNEGGGEVLYMYYPDPKLEPAKAMLLKKDGNELHWMHIDKVLRGTIYVFKRS